MAAKVDLTPELRESIFQLYILHGVKKRVAEELGVSVPVVTKVINEIPPEEVEKARIEAMAGIASRIQGKVAMAIDTLVKDDFDGGNGKKVPNLMQKTTAIAILTDKFVLLNKHMLEYNQMLRDAKDGAGAAVPVNIAQLQAALQNQMKILAPLMPPPPAPRETPPPPAPLPTGPRILTLKDLDNAGTTSN